ncbi:MAG: surface lipoprotein assembly modifier [Pseudomonadota bacterium]
MRPINKIKSGFLVIALSAAAFAPIHAHASPITFDQVLASPDDLELNLKYARQEVASGRLQQAASALERLLLLRPNWDSVRLFYGIVLYRLNDLEGTKRELTILDGRGLSPSEERDRVRYLALAEHGSKRLRISSRYTVGARVDSNPGFDGEDLDDRDARENDFGFTGASQFRLEYDLNSPNGNYLFFQSNSRINEFFDVEEADLIVTRGKAGAAFFVSDFALTPYAAYSFASLQHEHFRDEYGGGLEARWSISAQVDLYLKGQGVYQNYSATDFSSVGDQRDGWRASVDGGFKWRPTDAQSFGIDIGYARKDADFDGFSYDEGHIKLKSLTLFGKGRYLALSAGYTARQYDEPDNFYSATITRDDDRFFGRAAIGAPLETALDWTNLELPNWLSDVVVQVGVSYTNQESSINLLDYQNVSGDILFTKRINF